VTFAGIRLRLRVVLAPLAAAAAAAVLPAAAAGGTLESPVRGEIALGAAFRDTVLAGPSLRRLQAAQTWGGTYATAGGEQVAVRVSDSYPQDPALAQRWADYLAGLVHGTELSTVTLFLAPLAEVQAQCGRGAYACYGRGLILAPGEDPDPQVSAEAVVAHEYGHHVAASRDNAPWDAVDWGTKRWASYVGVCALARTGSLFPGDEGQHYTLNPGEGFAEAYRVLNERRAGLAETPWLVVSRSLYPDETALSLLAQDVTAPWTAGTQRSFAAPITRKKRTRAYPVATPYDGTLALTVRATGARVALDLLDGGRSVARTVVAAGSTRSLSSTVCGARTLRARVTLLRGSGRFRLVVSRP
jgi:hypothetical protein